MIRDTEIVSSIRDQLAERIGADCIDVWFDDATQLQWQDGVLTVRGASEFRVEQLRRSYGKPLREIAAKVLQRPARVCFEVAPITDATGDALSTLPEASTAATSQQQAAPKETPASSACVEGSSPASAGRSRGAQSASLRSARGGSSNRAARPGRRFARLSQFHVGPCNRLAYGSVQVVLDQPGQINPVLLHGPSGSGKTHLLEAAWSHVRRQPGSRVIYLSSEQFTTYFLQALRGGGLPSFRHKYRELDLLILDDIQFFIGKQATINELLHTIDKLLRESRQVLLAADRPLGELAQLGPEMMTRIAGGLACELDPLDEKTRRQVLRRFAQDSRLTLSDGAIELLASRSISGDARNLRGAVNRLRAMHLSLNKPVTDSLVREVADELFPRNGSVVRLEDIERAVCEEFGLAGDQLRSDCRATRVVHPRMLAMWLARRHTPAALTEISTFFGRRSHSTVLSAQRKVADWVEQGAEVTRQHARDDVRQVLKRIERNLKSG